jgi:tetratricopeptide (TPR) repeat protein
LLAERQGDLGRAEALLTEALAGFTERGMTPWEAMSRFWLSNVAVQRHEYNQARTLLEEALRLQQRTGWGSGKALVLGNLAWVASLQGDLDRAEEISREALRLGWESSDLLTIVQQLVQLAAIAVERGDGSRAARLGGAAFALGETIGLDIRTSDHPDLDAAVMNLLGEAFAPAWHAGRSLTPEEAVIDALNAAPAVA